MHGRSISLSPHFYNGMPAAALAGVIWRKSRRSGCLGNCVEAAVLNRGHVALRNSRDPRGPALIFSRGEMAAFLAGAKDGEFDSVVTPATPRASATAFGDDPPRCASVLGHINSLADDDEWHCQLPEGHEDPCQAPDG